MAFIIISESERQATEPQRDRPSLLKAPGSKVGPTSIEWGGTEALTGLTDREVELVKKKLGTKSVNYIRTLSVKSLMKSKTCSEIVQYFRGKKGYRESTIKHTHAALSQAEAEKQRLSGAK